MCALKMILQMLVELVSDNRPEYLFLALFLWRYVRLVVHIISFWLYKPTPLPASPTVTRKDCTVIIPTVEPGNDDFTECIETVLANEPGAIIVVTVGAKLRAEVRAIVARYRAAWPNTKIKVLMTQQANKRIQVSHAIPHVKTPITVLVDDHVFWPSVNFLPTVLAPFEDPKVGVVGTNKRVRRTEPGFGIKAFWNTVGCLYLERHNFEIRASNAIDGGVFVISGRTGVHRTQVLQGPGFIEGFTNERFFFGMFGPLNADDDNFITRWYVTNGWKIKIQYNEDATIETTLGTYPKFLSQCLRWARTTWRSNTASLITDRTVWYAQPWCVYAIYLTSFTNFALFTDGALFYLLSQSSFCTRQHLLLLAAWIFASKLVKTIPFYLRNPADLVYLPAHIAFGYYHSLIKLWAGLTFYNCVWGGRNLAAIDADAAPAGDDDDDDDDSDYHSAKGSSKHSSKRSSSSSFDAYFDADEDFPARQLHGELQQSFGPKPKNPFATQKTQTRTRTPSPASSVATPWGSASPKSLHLAPANVLESRQPVITRRNPFNSGRAEPQWACKTTQPVQFRTRSPLPLVQKTWVRGQQCQRVHSTEL